MSLLGIALVCIASLSANRRELETYSFSTGTADDEIVSFYIPAVGMVSNLNPFAPDSMRSFVKMISNFVLIGPRLFGAAIQRAREIHKLNDVDVLHCSLVLAHLARQSQRVPLSDLVLLLPKPSDAAATLSQILAIDGTLFLKSEPAAMTLLPDLRSELRSRIAKKKSKVLPSRDELAADP